MYTLLRFYTFTVIYNICINYTKHRDGPLSIAKVIPCDVQWRGEPNFAGADLPGKR